MQHVHYICNDRVFRQMRREKIHLSHETKKDQMTDILGQVKQDGDNLHW